MAQLCAALDAAEAAAWDRIGGPTDADFRLIDTLERKIEGRRADSAEAAVWRAKRLVRAVVNDWDECEVRALAAAANRDLMAFGI
jgi:hypothetical protein